MESPLNLGGQPESYKVHKGTLSHHMVMHFRYDYIVSSLIYCIISLGPPMC
jgi:hypothetical protein